MTTTKRLAFATVIALLSSGMLFANGAQEIPAPMAADGVQNEVVQDDGVLVTAVLEDSAAEQAGLRRGDVILSMNGTAVSTPYELSSRISEMRAGDQLDLRVRSGDETASVTVTLDDRYNMPPLGVRAHPEPGSFARRPMGPGAYRILAVEEGSPADDAGMEAGYIVTGIDGEIAPGETITVSYLDSAIGASRFGFDGSKEEPETAALTVGEQDGGAYIGVRYQQIGAAGSAAMRSRGRPGMPGVAGHAAGPAAGFNGGDPRDDGFRGGGPRSRGPRSGR